VIDHALQALHWNRGARDRGRQDLRITGPAVGLAFT